MSSKVIRNELWYDTHYSSQENASHANVSFYKSYICFCVANEGCNDYHPMFFTHDRAWEEFFCVCIQLLNKTWKEMRATAEDFNKVRD